MRKQSQQSYGFVPFSIKSLAALLTCISLPMVVELMQYVPLVERAEHTYYYPFWYTLIISILINVAVLLFLILPLSLFVDNVLASLRLNGPVTRVISVIGTYFLLGIGSALLFSIFVFKMDAFQYVGPYQYVVITTFVFLLWQSGLGWIVNKARNQGQTNTK
ncbi:MULTISPECIES: hypothetical protein [unclassified Paenibacillus]|uniref:hypothetical protein n=1 Tax=unclassified Paenibacillus TaxID=185978 RepID=UPI0004646BD5|nr:MULTISPECIES: hypothetical protein [unclassified Paenibacillus]KGP79224.1 hypothetical protein P364_0125190 [Paenibacillus sp. MAEPY2]KGP84009.1 hypothetical protein P363_0124315 [Paenibacillus sp. MAEPY1]